MKQKRYRSRVTGYRATTDGCTLLYGMPYSGSRKRFYVSSIRYSPTVGLNALSPVSRDNHKSWFYACICTLKPRIKRSKKFRRNDSHRLLAYGKSIFIRYRKRKN